jgi:type II secretory pathway component GspD/PulD (secretin)
MSTAAADHPLTIIELHHRLPSELIPQLAPLAGPDGVVTGANDVLLVRAAPARLADIRRALAELDRPARNLLVEVRSTLDTGERRRGVALGVDERVGERGRVVLGPGGNTGIEVRAGDRQTEQRVLQRLRVLDGGSARIQVGATTPVPVRERWRTPSGAWQRDGIVGVDTGIGFTVTPRVVGGRVVVDIDQRATMLGDGGVSGGGVRTQVSGPLGVWLPLGGTDAAGRGTARGLAGAGQAASEGLSALELRVTAVD